MVDVCACASNWRIELTDLLTGAVTHVIVPIEFEFETAFMEPGRGTITFHRRGTAVGNEGGFVDAFYTFPGKTGIFFQRIHGGAATPQNPVNMFGGYVETMQGNSDGTITLGFAEMQKYLDYRLIRSDLVFSGLSQNFIARDLVMYARGENINGGSTDPDTSFGIPLIGGLGASAFNRDRTYLAVERPVIGEMLRQLTQVIDGPVYQMFHYRQPTPGLTDGWYSEMGFFDTLTQSSFPTITWNELTDFTVNLDINEMANQVDAIGDPQPDGTATIATATTPFSDTPRWDAAPSFSGVQGLVALGQNAFGYQQDHMDPATALRLDFSGLEYGDIGGNYTLSLDNLLPGFQFNLDIHSPEWDIVGGPDLPGGNIPTVGRVSVSAGLEGPERVTVQAIVDSFPTNLLSSGQPPECEDC